MMRIVTRTFICVSGSDDRTRYLNCATIDELKRKVMDHIFLVDIHSKKDIYILNNATNFLVKPFEEF